MALNAYSWAREVIAINNTFLTALFNFLSRFFAALAEEQAEQEDTMASGTEWTGAPPYRYIDVSRWQGKIKMEGWAQVKAAGYKGVMLRAVGSRNYVPYIDPTFEDNYSNAKAAGLDVGAYYYTNATSEEMANRELAVLRKVLVGKEMTMPVAVDLESPILAGMPYGNLSNLAAYHWNRLRRWASSPSSTPTRATQTSIWTWQDLQGGGTYGWRTTPARPPRLVLSTTPTSTPARAACLVFPAT